MLQTYFNLRMSIGFVALVFPIILLVNSIGGIQCDESAGLCTLKSISAYYYNTVFYKSLFIGVLVFMGSLLMLYKGYSREEDVALNLAGLFAWGVALFPTRPELIDDLEQVPEILTNFLGLSYSLIHGLHLVFAVAFFACIGYVCWFRSSETLEHLNPDSSKENYKRAYKGFAILLVFSHYVLLRSRS